MISVIRDTPISSRRSSGCPRTISLDDRGSRNSSPEVTPRTNTPFQFTTTHNPAIFFSCDFNYTVCIWGYFSAKMNERKLWKARGVLIPQIHSAYLDRFVPHQVGHGIGRGLPNVRKSSTSDTTSYVTHNRSWRDTKNNIELSEQFIVLKSCDLQIVNNICCFIYMWCQFTN